MIWRAFQEMERAGVLGMNRRNAEYIMRHNPRAAYPLVDDKILTKKLAAQHGIPTPPLYFVIARHSEIAGLDELLGDRQEFVLKPARGSGGSGIVLITARSPRGFVTQSGKEMSREDLRYHITEILSGIYSLAALEDRVIVEGLVHPAPVFSLVTHQGVPDIRVVVYRGVPVMAMVRLPTRASDGKANLHRGAIGAGIDLVLGETLTAVHRSKVIHRHPDTGQAVSGIRVPYWDQMLFLAARTLEMTGMGYLGVDVVIDRDRGPLLLELNARPGLAIQMANRLGLRRRLNRVDQAPPEIFQTPESRVLWIKEVLREGKV